MSNDGRDGANEGAPGRSAGASEWTDVELYARGARTMVASWAAYAAGSEGAAIVRGPGVDAGVFPSGPEREFYNNALLARGLNGDARATAIDAMEHAYAEASITDFAAWVHESEVDLQGDLSGRGYAVTESTRAMAMAISALQSPTADIELGPSTWSYYLQVAELPPGMLAGVEPGVFGVAIGEVDGLPVTSALSFESGGDCGVFNVETHEAYRRRGLGTAVTAMLLRRAAERGCTTASIQATPMAERVYAAVGFRDLGRFLEFTRAPAPK